MIELIAAGMIGGLVGGTLTYFCSEISIRKLQKRLQVEAVELNAQTANLNAQTYELLRSTENMKRLSDLKERELRLQRLLEPRGWENPFQRRHL